MYNLETINVVDKLNLNIISNIVSALEHGNYSQAQNLIQELYEEKKIHDFRCMFYYLFSVYSQGNYAESIKMSRHINIMLNDYFDHISPLLKRDQVITKTLNWFAKYFPGKCEDLNILNQSPEAQLSLLEEIRKILSHLEKINIFSPQFKIFIEQYLHKIRSMQRDVGAEKVVESVNEPSLIKSCSDELDKKNDNCFEETQSIEDAAKTSPQKDQSTTTQNIIFSAAWDNLFSLISEYQACIKEKKFELAYLIQQKIEIMLSEFDPVRYFPTCFKDYIITKLNYFNEIKEVEDKNIYNLPYTNVINGILDKDVSLLRELLKDYPFSLTQLKNKQESNQYADSSILDEYDDP